MTLKFKISALLLFFALTLKAQEKNFPYRDGKLWGLCDEKATILIAAKYDTIKNIKSNGKNFFEATLGKDNGIFIGSKNVIPVEFQDFRYLSNNLLIAVKKDANKKEMHYLYNTNGDLIINQPLSYLKGFKGRDQYDVDFIIGFYTRDLEGKESLINIDIYNKNQITYLIKDVHSINLNNKNSKPELAIAHIKQTETSATETKYFRVDGSKIILLDAIKDKQYIEDNSGKKKKDYTIYDSPDAIPDMGNDVMIEEPPSGSGNGTGRSETNKNTLKKSISYYKYKLSENPIQNEIEVEISNNTKYKKFIKFPFKVDKLEVLHTKRMLYDEKSVSDTLKKYQSIIIYQKKNKFGLTYKFPFEKSTQYDFLEPIKTEKRYDFHAKDFFKIGLLNKKDKTIKFGIIDVDHNQILSTEYDEIKMGFNIDPNSKEQVFLVKKNNLYGLISEKKEIILPVEFSNIAFDSKNQSFLKIKKGNQYSAYVSHYSEGKYILSLLPAYFNYQVKEIKYNISSGKKGISLLEAIDYIVLEDENGKFKGLANPNGTLYFKD